MADYQSGGISFGGLGSGTDFSQIIEQMKKVESIQMNRLLSWHGDWKVRVEGFEEINGEIQKLRTLAQTLDTPAEFVSKKATSSTTTVATATTTADVTEGLYSIEVNQVARNAMITYGYAFDEKDSVINADPGPKTFEYEYKGETRTISVASGTTLEGFVNMINGDAQNPGVRASLVKTGDKYLFQIRGMDLGAENDLNITSSNIVGLSTVPGMYTKQTAQNAQFRVNNFPASPEWLESSTNTVTEVVDGMTLTLKEAGTTQISVNSDTGDIKDKIKELIEGINTVRTKIIELTSVDDEAEARDPGKTESQFDAEIGSALTGNYGVQMIGTRIKNLTATRAKGFVPYDPVTEQGDKITALSQIGILTVADRTDEMNGLLKLDEEKLDEALRENPEGVIALFAADLTGRTDNGDFSVVSTLKPGVEGYVTHPGEHDVSYTVDASGNIVESSIMISGTQGKLEGNQIIAIEGPAKGLSLQVNNLAPGSYSGKAYIQQGKGGELVTALGDMLGEEGTLNIIKKNYKEIMSNIEEKIIKEQERMVRWERSMRLKFSRLDTTLSGYNGKMQQLQAQMSGLTQGG